MKNDGIVTIFSLDGKAILIKEIREGADKIELDLGNIEPGIYLCQVTTDGRSLMKKLIKE